MYKPLVRALIRRSIARLNEGDPSMLVKLASPDVELRFPGDNSWARMFRPVIKGREPHATHRGLAECQAFADAFVKAGLHLDIEDILVNGPPWRTRICVRAVDHCAGENGEDVYNNRVAMLLEVRWGKTISWEDYEDCERVAAWDQLRGTAEPMRS